MPHFQLELAQEEFIRQMRHILQANVPGHRLQSFTSYSDPTVNPDFWGPALTGGDHVGGSHGDSVPNEVSAASAVDSTGW